MKIPSQNQYRQNVERLARAYEALGRDGLAKMSAAELGTLLAEKTVDLRIANSRLRQYPHDELSQMRRDQSDAAVNEISGFIKEQEKHKGVER